MAFHHNKCNKMTVTGKRDPIMTDYDLHGHTLANVPSAKYLSVTVTQDLKWDTHIQNICVKANQTIGFLRRNLNSPSTRRSFHQAAGLLQSSSPPVRVFQQCVGPSHSEKHQETRDGPTQGGYICTTQAPQHIKHHRYASNSELAKPRKQEEDMRLCMMFKIDRGLVAISKDSRLIQQKRPTRHSHSRAFQTITCGTEKRRMSFFPRTVRDWNALPPDIPDLETLEAFKASVSRLTY